jgi:TetR/AcrR family transcriptional repressor of nem operon
MSSEETASKLLDAAQVLIQERGYNAFSYKDLAEAVGIRTASIHYHFPGKASLGLALMERYIADLDRALAGIGRNARTHKGKLKSFIKLYADTEARGAICLCGSLASDSGTLPSPLQDAVKIYIENSEQWIAATVKEGVRQGEFQFKGKASDAAASLLSSLQGGLILSRAKGGAQPLLATLQRVFLNTLEAA